MFLQLCNPFCYLDSGGLKFRLYDCIHLVLYGVVKRSCAGHEEEGGGHDVERLNNAFQQLVGNELAPGLNDAQVILRYVEFFCKLFL